MQKKIKRINSLLLLTFKEGIRENVFYGICVTFFFLLGINFLLGQMSGVEESKVLRDMGLVSIELTGLLVIIFFLVNSYSRDRDSKMLDVFLTRFSRTEFIFGKYLGYVLILFVFGLVSGGFFYVFLLFNRAQQLAIWAAIYFTFLKLSIISSIAMIFSLLFYSTALSGLLSLGIYVAGSTARYSLEVLRQSKASFLQTTIVRFYYHILPSLDRFEIKLMASYGELPTGWYFFISTLYAFFYIAIVLMLSIYLFRCKDL